VEAGEAQAFTLTSLHRYAHSIDYLRSLANGVGFRLLEAEPQIGRYEGKVKVPAFAVVLRSGKAF
jgi:predicted TPR repeat methyltransferase